MAAEATNAHCELYSASAELRAITSRLELIDSRVRSEVNIELNFEGLVLGCIDADFCK